MDKFVVSARKYRPQNFKTVVGQSHITTTLKNAIANNQLAHAFLFCGPRGVGKTTCARILAKTINCQSRTTDGEACDTCNSCQSFNQGTSLNIHELDAASNNSVDDIRVLVEQIRFAPQSGDYKLYIIDEVHMLSSNAFNAFLKTLEEPPSYVKFILATTEKHKILPTILSRCQIFDFKRITLHDTVEHLEEIITAENVDAEKAALQVIAQKSEGCMRDALSILDKIVSFTGGKLTYKNTLENLNILDDNYFFELLNALLKEDLAATLLNYDEINKKGFEGDLVINGFATFLRNILVCKDAKAAALLDVVEGMQPQYLETAKRISTSFIISALNLLSEAEQQYKAARNKRLHVEMLLIKLNYLQQALTIETDTTTTSSLKKKQLNQPLIFREKKLTKTLCVASSNTNTPTVKKHTEGKLYIEANNTTPATVTNNQPSNLPPPTTPVRQLPTVREYTPADPKNKVTLLEKLQAQLGGNFEVKPIRNPENLNEEKLLAIWKDYVLKLEQLGKTTVFGALSTAKISIISELRFTVTVYSILQKKFIDTEKNDIADCIRNEFFNQQIGFDIIIEETQDDADTNAVKHLSSHERYLMMAEKFPAVKHLKETLNLDVELP